MSPTLDGGSAFPLSTTAAQGTRAAVSQTGVTTNGAGLVVIALSGNGSANVFPYTSVTVNGNAATKINDLTWTGSFPGQGTAEVWAYWSSGALSSVTVTANHSSTTTVEAITVWAYTAASVVDGSSNVASCFAALGGYQQDASGQVKADLTGVLSSSVIVGAFMEGASNGGLTALGNTNWRASIDDAFGCSLRTGDSSSQSGSVTVGSSTSQTFLATAAAEVLAPSSTSTGQLDGLGDNDSQSAWKYAQPYTLFQPNAFQQNAFAILGGTTGTSGPSGGELDTLGDSESQVSKQTQVSSESDTLGFSDPQVAKQGQAAVQSDTLGFSESQTAAQKQAGVQTDTLGFSESQASTLGAPSGLSAGQQDTLGDSESQVSKQTQASVQTDTLGFSDSQVSKQGQGSAETDTLGLTDSQVSLQGQASVQTDTLGFGESQGSTLGSASTLTAAETDTLGFSESQASKQAQQSVQIDVLGLSDRQIALQLQIAVQKDTLGFGDACAATLALGPSGGETDTLGFGDSQASAIAGVSATGVEKDTLGLGDACSADVWFAQQQNFFIWDGSKWVGGQFP